MKPWPETVRRMYPLARGLWPNRPWWRYVQVDRAWRRMGLDERVNLYQTEDLQNPRRPDEAILAEMEALDGAHPLPFPGLRVGQVWAVLAKDDSIDRVLTVTDYHASRPRPWLVSGHWLGTEALVALVRDALLVTDGCCPWAAPWRS